MENSNLSPIIQYLVIPKSLKKWSKGALVAQGGHAASKAILSSIDSPIWQELETRHDEREKAKNIEKIHMIVLECKDTTNLTMLSDELINNDVHHILWEEKPENVVTCLATHPCLKSSIEYYFKEFPLMK
ncbi:hypothetical protein SNEBB_006152 [Seison nebaliae]|nr:hypothetical protein SNEBB_006152 [Seison nebaliae]